MTRKINSAKKTLSRIAVVFFILMVDSKEKIIEKETAAVRNFAESLYPSQQALGDSKFPTTSHPDNPSHEASHDTEKSKLIAEKKNLSDSFAEALRILTILTILVMYGLTEVFIEFSFDRWRILRKIAMTSDDIEGIWIDFLRMSDKVVGGAWIVIEYRNGIYTIEGEDFDTQGHFRGKFESTLAEYDNRRLDYKYVVLTTGETGEKTGNGWYKFYGSGDHRVVNFIGVFYQDQFNRRFYTYGERMKEFLNKKDYKYFRKPENRGELIVKFIKERQRTFSGPENSIDSPTEI